MGDLQLYATDVCSPSGPVAQIRCAVKSQKTERNDHIKQHLQHLKVKAPEVRLQSRELRLRSCWEEGLLRSFIALDAPSSLIPSSHTRSPHWGCNDLVKNDHFVKSDSFVQINNFFVLNKLASMSYFNVNENVQICICAEQNIYRSPTQGKEFVLECHLAAGWCSLTSGVGGCNSATFNISGSYPAFVDH